MKRAMGNSNEAQVTAVIPTRNRLPWLQQAVSSALEQRDTRVDVVVVDEASSDGTAEWLASLDDPRVRFVRHDVPRKLPGARNAGLELVTTPWVAFLDDDDLWSPTKISRQLAAVADQGARWCYAAEVTVDADLNVIDIPTPPGALDIPSLLPIRNVIPAGGSGVLIASDLVRSVGGFDEELVAAEDWECWLRVLKTGELPAAVLTPSVAYRWGAASMSMEIDRMRHSYDQVRERHPLDEAHARVAWARNERFLAFNLARHGLWRASLAALRRSAAPDPLRHLVLGIWVVVARREWPTRSLRRVGDRQAVSETDHWLDRFRLSVAHNSST